jgi:hypothetical protein
MSAKFTFYTSDIFHMLNAHKVRENERKKAAANYKVICIKK